MADCEHDWRVDPRFVYTSNPPQSKAVCVTCKKSKFVPTHISFDPITEDPETWPKIGEILMNPKEGFCPNPLGDGQHCSCWWDCSPCCGCDFDGGGEDCDCERHTLLRGETWIP